MKKTIKGKTYNTKTATSLKIRTNNLPQNDLKYYREELMITKEGNYFLAGEGGAMTRYAKTHSDGNAGYGEDILPICERIAKKILNDEYVDPYELYDEK